MKTYTETKNKKPFDWNAFLEKETYTYNQLIRAKELAGDWVTCASGSQCSIIDRDEDGEPQDSKLTNLGIRFGREIDNMRFYSTNTRSFLTSKKRAKNILLNIEKRSAFLINKKIGEIKQTLTQFGLKVVKK